VSELTRPQVDDAGRALIIRKKIEEAQEQLIENGDFLSENEAEEYPAHTPQQHVAQPHQGYYQRPAAIDRYNMPRHPYANYAPAPAPPPAAAAAAAAATPHVVSSNSSGTVNASAPSFTPSWLEAPEAATAAVEPGTEEPNR